MDKKDHTEHLDYLGLVRRPPFASPFPVNIQIQPDSLLHLTWQALDGEQVVLSCRLWNTHPQHMMLVVRGEVPSPQALPVGQPVIVEFRTAAGVVSIPGRLDRFIWLQGGLIIVLTGPAIINERRRYPRVALTLPATPAVVLGTGGRLPYECLVRMYDISLGGARFVTDQPLSPFDQIRLSIQLDEGEPIEPTVTVLACAGEPGPDSTYIIRGAFTVIAPEAHQRISAYVTRRQVAELHTFV